MCAKHCRYAPYFVILSLQYHSVTLKVQRKALGIATKRRIDALYMNQILNGCLKTLLGIYWIL